MIQDFTPARVQQHLSDLKQLMSELPAGVPNGNWDEKALLLPMPDKWSLSFGVFMEGHLKAFVFGSSKEGKYHIHYIAVARDARGQGIGSFMVKEVEKRAKASGLGGITVKVFKQNRMGIRFYLKQGFVIREEAVGEAGGYDLLEKEFLNWTG